MMSSNTLADEEGQMRDAQFTDHLGVGAQTGFQ